VPRAGRPSTPQLQTARLLLRRWRPRDLEPFAAMNADAEVMEHFPAPLSARQSAALVDRIERCFEERGYGLWAVELRAVRAHGPDGAFAGFVGLDPVEDERLAFAPAVELGWRLAQPFWGRGIATEAASAAIAFAFDELALAELVSYTAAINVRSRRVMERLGMSRNPAEDFLHPGIAPGQPLAPHVLYRLDAHARR
jgi:RimJ/RimL family protein N-acetyltransferase